MRSGETIPAAMGDDSNLQEKSIRNHFALKMLT